MMQVIGTDPTRPVQEGKEARRRRRTVGGGGGGQERGEEEEEERISIVGIESTGTPVSRFT